jgi:hypothetical protein
MTARLIAGVLALGCLTLVGCSTKEGQRVVQYERGTHLQEKKTSAAGRYTLHSPGRPDVTYLVQKGEKVGFRPGHENRIEAYAGDNPPVELDRGAAHGAYWQFDGKSGK